MASLVERVRQALLSRCRVEDGEAVVVAVSGGLDSVVLLHLLHRLARGQGWRTMVAHFNHQLRRRASDLDEQFVARMAQALGLPFEVGRADVSRHARDHKLSIEMAARDLRHRFLAGIAQKHGGSKIALAHHADDQVETFFLRLLRGAGGDGLHGMRFASPSPADPVLQLIRPLLDIPRRALAEYAAVHRLRFRRDATNAALDRQRNWVRHRLLPLLQRNLQPALGSTVLRAMNILGAEADWVTTTARKWLAGGDGEPFGSLHPAVQRKVIQSQLWELGVTTTFDLVEQLRNAPGRAVMTRPGQRVWRDVAGRLHHGEADRTDFGTQSACFTLAGAEGTLRFAGMEVRWKRTTARPTQRRLKRRAGREWFDADRVGEEVILRHWQPGDRFQPIGLAHDAKLQDLYTNLKVPRAQRHERVLAARPAGGVFWVEGLRIAEPFKMAANTRRSLEWRWQRISTNGDGTVATAGT